MAEGPVLSRSVLSYPVLSCPNKRGWADHFVGTSQAGHGKASCFRILASKTNTSSCRLNDSAARTQSSFQSTRLDVVLPCHKAKGVSCSTSHRLAQLGRVQRPKFLPCPVIAIKFMTSRIQMKHASTQTAGEQPQQSDIRVRAALQTFLTTGSKRANKIFSHFCKF